MAGLTPFDLKLNQIVNYFDIKTSNNVIINDINCDFIEKVVNHKLLPHPSSKMCAH
jgi:hypothetical protein